MTIAELKDLVTAAPIRQDNLAAVLRVLAFLSTMQDDAIAPGAIWNDSGLLIVHDQAGVRIYCAGRVDGWWISYRSEDELIAARAASESVPQPADGTGEYRADRLVTDSQPGGDRGECDALAP
jgi:hypothetical protein